jgi:hypothetical protein
MCLDDKILFVVPRSSGKPRGPILCKQLDQIKRLGMRLRASLPSTSSADQASRKPAYIAAIMIEAFPGWAG